MIRSARVLTDALAQQSVRVEVDSISACQRCANGQGCGAGIFNQGISAAQIDCYTPLSVAANQHVDIEIDDGGSTWLWLVAGAYGLPLLGFVSASLAAGLWVSKLPETYLHNSVFSADALVAAAAFTGLCGGLIAWRTVSAYVLSHLETGLCIQSARIVGETSSSDTSLRESPDEF